MRVPGQGNLTGFYVIAEVVIGHPAGPAWSRLLPPPRLASSYIRLSCATNLGAVAPRVREGRLQGQRERVHLLRQARRGVTTRRT